MAQINTLQVTETVFRWRNEGLEKTQSEADKLAGSLGKVTAAQAKATDAESKAAASADRAAQGKAKLATANDRFQAQMQAQAQILGMAQSQQDALTAATQRFSDAQSAAARSAAAATGRRTTTCSRWRSRTRRIEQPGSSRSSTPCW
ncbi:hypothetical protein CTI14_05250 [Methylobacterium radiotolerans]|nr:hypothetical protein CTI14_05250 [Methylobacterium radiotolerans]